MNDYYAILNIAANSNESEIRKAYRSLAKKYHPDINKSKNAQEKFIEISEAYEFLINHFQKYNEPYTTAPYPGSKTEHFHKSEEYEEFRKYARQKAQQHSKMRYEQFKKQHEAFEKSGLNDIGLLFIIITRIASVPLFLFLVLLPVYVAVYNEWTMIFLLVITWPFAGILALNYFNKRKQYFKPGKFYYSIPRVKELYTEIKQTDELCYYCENRKADSHPYKIELLKLKDLKLHSSGFRQHNTTYVNETASILIPRSRKAFIIHSSNSLIKIASILSFLAFFSISSFTWRIIIGMVTAGIICSLVLLITRTKSNISFLFSYGTIFRVAIWIILIASVSEFQLNPFNVSTSGYIFFVITSIAIFDSFLMQLVNFVFGKYSSKPLPRQYSEIIRKINEGYKVYNDVTIISFVYPIFKWIFA